LGVKRKLVRKGGRTNQEAELE
jgi:tRNA(His) guanylyltransferase